MWHTVTFQRCSDEDLFSCELHVTCKAVNHYTSGPLCVCAYTRMCKYTHMHSLFRLWARNDKCKSVHDARPEQSANVSVSGTCFIDTIAI